MARAIIESGLANVNAVRVTDRCSPAHLSVQLGSPMLVSALVGRGANLSLQDVRGLAVLHLATKMTCQKHPEGIALMELLIKSE